MFGIVMAVITGAVASLPERAPDTAVGEVCGMFERGGDERGIGESG